MGRPSLSSTPTAPRRMLRIWSSWQTRIRGRLKQSGESDSSIKRFMADWCSDADAPGDYGVESEPIAQTVAEEKRPRTDDDTAGTSKVPRKKSGHPPRRPAPAPTA